MALEPLVGVAEPRGEATGEACDAARYRLGREQLAQHLRGEAACGDERERDLGIGADRAGMMQAFAQNLGALSAAMCRQAVIESSGRKTLGAQERPRPRLADSPRRSGDERGGARVPEPRRELLSRATVHNLHERVGVHRELARREKRLSWGAEVRVADGEGGLVERDRHLGRTV